MLHQLNNLPDEELQELYDAIPVITLLIAGADGDIEGSELEQSEPSISPRVQNWSNQKKLQEYEVSQVARSCKIFMTILVKIIRKD